MVGTYSRDGYVLNRNGKYRYVNKRGDKSLTITYDGP
jgi:hypothetical protein